MCVWAENVDAVVDKVVPRLSTIGILNRQSLCYTVHVGFCLALKLPRLHSKVI